MWDPCICGHYGDVWGNGGKWAKFDTNGNRRPRRLDLRRNLFAYYEGHGDGDYEKRNNFCKISFFCLARSKSVLGLYFFPWTGKCDFWTFWAVSGHNLPGVYVWVLVSFALVMWFRIHMLCLWSFFGSNPCSDPNFRLVRNREMAKITVYGHFELFLATTCQGCMCEFWSVLHL